MHSIGKTFDRVDRHITAWMASNGIVILRMSIGIVFFWFGFLKYFPGQSPAAGIATLTIQKLTFGQINPEVSILLLATWECAIGLGFLSGRFLRATILLLFLQMVGTMTPIILLPGEVFTVAPFVPTLEGQYIFKNIVLISAGIVIGATVRGGAIVAERRSQEHV
jgi:uncharacterized membrane protein YphA (DoxX/SURF4 family)